MTIALTVKNYNELLKTKENHTANSALEQCEYLDEMPKHLGRGYYRAIEIYPELLLTIFDKQYHQDIVLKIPVSNHPLQFGALALGMYTDTYGHIGEGHTLISGGGVQQKMDVVYPHSQRIIGIDIEMPPQLLKTFFPGKDGEMLPQLKFLDKESGCQTLLYPKTNAAIQGVVLQIINCPYQGTAKRMYLQGKIIELMSLQLAPFLADNTVSQLPLRLKKETITKINHAKEILQARLENPPLLSELAQQVGVSESTLQRGFQMQFGTTVFGYLTNQRMEQAHQLLQNRSFTVAEVANIVGYSHLGHFAAAFKRKFGITPRECSLSKKLVSGL
ncbi:helix-turn-helix transcriptional regulator [Anabaena cylindrica FACHB-243]|uniref:Transcriptional regulator, AraC family n=1 Tax=Anabaena cylindrica (strain ATCC 27899 / PCC 7122) TaxID=272123 RepID=K9ZK86_ANACC|nr:MULTISPECIES: AraC family transcriptional regulator [Anabaena]AFZ59626.1 transcriptional regulator, AraC family [Anabaena cylindrica PCC 7122]MBD2418711.1 helix-turn-helix transcriptional regulator [Anabaena cylindrica FACHB-243]MBY5281662.1 helix-turn-helix transcriptional regulator [Anabaena sp. CCAP 1446/1C]MBY5309188.1 helix-turn-helix transcriptional regulator [Anabaena sp. CCAP 1446/1C]MCM2406274.1 AraC family transcriptional regulator [Anabaena sp. CCAP 1446/1C]